MIKKIKNNNNYIYLIIFIIILVIISLYILYYKKNENFISFTNKNNSNSENFNNNNLNSKDDDIKLMTLKNIKKLSNDKALMKLSDLDKEIRNDLFSNYSFFKSNKVYRFNKNANEYNLTE